MKKLTLVFVALLTMASSACSEQGLAPSSPVAPGSLGDTDAKGSAKPSANIAATTTIQDSALQIQSDGGGPYLHSKTLSSTIQAIGDWELDAINPRGATRRIYLAFSESAGGTVPGDLQVPGTYRFRVLAQCASYNSSLLEEWPVNVTKSCPLRIAFDTDAGVRYAIVMNPTGGVNGPFPTTNFANVTCTLGNGTACSRWEFAPSTPAGNVGRLLRFNSNQTVTQDHGDFRFSFSILVAKS